LDDYREALKLRRPTKKPGKTFDDRLANETKHAALYHVPNAPAEKDIAGNPPKNPWW
jgi:hypothetical protein